jgi:hypothetical protein
MPAEKNKLRYLIIGNEFQKCTPVARRVQGGEQHQKDRRSAQPSPHGSSMSTLFCASGVRAAEVLLCTARCISQVGCEHSINTELPNVCGVLAGQGL